MGFTVDDKMFASQQGLCSCKFVLHVSGQWTDNEQINGNLNENN